MGIIDQINLDFYDALWSDEHHYHAYPNINTVRCEAWYFKAHGGKPGHLLDYGHGCGLEAFHFAKLGYQVNALEVSVAALKHLNAKLDGEWRSYASNIKTTLLNPEASVLPYDNNTFDYINSTQVVYHLPDEAALIALMSEWYRVLRPEGKIMFSTIGPGNSLVTEGNLIRNENRLKIYQHEHPHKIGGQRRTLRSLYISTEEDLRKLCEPFFVDEIGWYTNHYCGIDGYHWQVLARKL